MRRRFVVALLTIAVVALALPATGLAHHKDGHNPPGQSKKAPPGQSKKAPLTFTGQVQEKDIPGEPGQDGETWDAAVTVREVANQGGQLVATEYSYRFENTTTNEVKRGTADVARGDPALPLGRPSGAQSGDVGVQQLPASCEILNLVIGPIFLDLLGLQLETSEITVDLRGVTGPGRLLGNLLCAITGILDPEPPPVPGLEELLGQLIDILNEILAGLG